MANSRIVSFKHDVQVLMQKVAEGNLDDFDESIERLSSRLNELKDERIESPTLDVNELEELLEIEKSIRLLRKTIWERMGYFSVEVLDISPEELNRRIGKYITDARKLIKEFQSYIAQPTQCSRELRERYQKQCHLYAELFATEKALLDSNKTVASSILQSILLGFAAAEELNNIFLELIPKLFNSESNVNSESSTNTELTTLISVNQGRDVPPVPTGSRKNYYPRDLDLERSQRTEEVDPDNLDGIFTVFDKYPDPIGNLGDLDAGAPRTSRSGRPFKEYHKRIEQKFDTHKFRTDKKYQTDVIVTLMDQVRAAMGNGWKDIDLSATEPKLIEIGIKYAFAWYEIGIDLGKIQPGQLLGINRVDQYGNQQPVVRTNVRGVDEMKQVMKRHCSTNGSLNVNATSFLDDFNRLGLQASQAQTQEHTLRSDSPFTSTPPRGQRVTGGLTGRDTLPSLNLSDVRQTVR